MPRLSAWLIRAALLYLALGFLLGALMLFNKGVPLHGALWRLLPIHIEFVLVGWTLQLALGVAYWALPRFDRERRREAWAALAGALLNLGILAVAVSAWPGLAPLALLGRAAELGAALAFGWHAWPRVKPMAS